MRRGEKAILERAEIDAVLRHSQVCRLGFTDGLEPYIVPLNFGYDGRALYFHCAREGRKLELLRRNPRVCFEFDLAEGIVRDATACRCSMRYRSVMGVGTARMIEDPAGRLEALSLLMAQYAEGPFEFPEATAARVAVFRVDVESISGKQSPRA